MAFPEKVENLMLYCHDNIVNVNITNLTSSLTETPSRPWLVLMTIMKKTNLQMKKNKQDELNSKRCINDIRPVFFVSNKNNKI